MKKVVKTLLVSVALLGLIVSSLGSVVVNAQEKIKVAIVQLVSHPSLDEIVAGIKDGLTEAGYKEGENLEVEFQNAEGDFSLLTSIADTVINNQPDLIFAVTTPVAQTLADKTNEIPIIMAGVTDPIGAKLVESLDKPGANVTGVSDAVPNEPQFELIKEIAPNVKKIGMLYTTSEDSSLLELEAAAEVAQKLGFETEIKGIDSTLDMQLVAESLAGNVDAIFVGSDNTIASAFDTLLDATDKMGLPVFTTVDTFVKQGAIAAVAINQGDIGVQAANIAIEVLNGANPAETPVQFVENLVSVFNSETAKRLNIEISDDLKEKLTDISGE